MSKKPLYVAMAGLGSCAIVTMAMLIRRSEQKKLDRTPFIGAAVDYAKSQPDVMELLGTKYLVVGEASVMNRLASMTRLQATVKIPLEGDKDKSYLWVYADRKRDQDKYKIFKLEMTFDKMKDKKLVIFDLTDKMQETIEKEEQEKEKQENKT